MERQVIVGLNAVIVAVVGDVPRVLTVHPSRDALPESDRPALPFGPFDSTGDRTLELGLRRWARERTSLELGYVEQLYTFGDRFRDPREREGGPRLLSISYLALAHALPANPLTEAWYEFLPWEDHRDGRPPMIAGTIVPALASWIAEAPDATARAYRGERVASTFPDREEHWNDEAALERYELLYEAGAVDRIEGLSDEFGLPMALDHRRILATAIARLRGKIKYRPVVFELLAPTFTLFELQRTVEALAGRRLHKQNFRRFVETTGLVERTGSRSTSTGGRPAEAFRYRREVLGERLAPGLRLPGRSPKARNRDGT